MSDIELIEHADPNCPLCGGSGINHEYGCPKKCICIIGSDKNDCCEKEEFCATPFGPWILHKKEGEKAFLTWRYEDENTI